MAVSLPDVLDRACAAPDAGITLALIPEGEEEAATARVLEFACAMPHTARATVFAPHDTFAAVIELATSAARGAGVSDLWVECKSCLYTWAGGRGFKVTRGSAYPVPDERHLVIVLPGRATSTALAIMQRRGMRAVVVDTAARVAAVSRAGCRVVEAAV